MRCTFADALFLVCGEWGWGIYWSVTVRFGCGKDEVRLKKGGGWGRAAAVL